MEENPFINLVIFIHIPKTGGTYIKKLFDKSKYNLLRRGHHTPIKYIKETNFSFCVIRNPYERFLSSCNYNNIKDIEQFSNDLISSINYIGDYNIRYPEHFFTQKYYIYDNNKVSVDLIIRYEKLEEGILELKNKGVDITNSFKIKESKSFFWNNILTKKTISNINEIYKEDFESFNYKTI